MKRLVLAGGVLAGLVLVPVVGLSMMAGPPRIPAPSLASQESPLCSVPEPERGALTAQTVAAHAYRAGFRGEDVSIAVAVAKAESGWNPQATNHNANGSVDYGLMQINSIHAAILSAGQWADPADSMVMAHKIWTDAGKSWGPWVTFWSGAYRKHLQPVTIAPVCTQPVVTACNADTGDYGNGLIPASALCTLWADRRHRLRADAAGKFDALAKAYQVRFGVKPCITDSYRSLPAQYDVFRRKPGLAARPGTSNHGWGLALDLCGPGGGQWVAGSDYDVWMETQGVKFGWERPSWADAGGSKPESWHHECSSCGAK